MPGRFKSKVDKGIQSPLSTKALDINRINPGRRIVWYSRYSGFLGDYVVMERPTVRNGTLVISLRHVATGKVWDYRLHELGVTPSHGAFHEENFVVDYRDRYGRHALPSRRARRHPFIEQHERDLARAFGFE